MIISLILSSSGEMLSSGLTKHINLTIIHHLTTSIIPLQYDHIFLFNWPSLASLTSIKQHYVNLPFASKGKPLLANKSTESLNLLHPILILVITLSIELHRALTVSTVSKDRPFNSMLRQSSAMRVMSGLVLVFLLLLPLNIFHTLFY